MNRIKAIIFDFDGVVVKSNHIKTKAFRELYKNQEKNIINKIINYHKINAGTSRTKKILYFQKDILKKDFSKSSIAKKNMIFSNLVFEKVSNSKFVPGVKNFLKNNYTSKLLFISSGTPQKELRKICKNKDISFYFKGIYGSPLNKMAHIKKIMKKWNLKKNNILFIGDSMTDLNASKECELHFLGIGNYLKKIIDKSHFNQKDLTNLQRVIDKIEKNSI